MAERDNRHPFFIENGSIQLKKNVENIAKNKGYGSAAAYLRSLIIKAVDETPDKYKRDWRDIGT